MLDFLREITGAVTAVEVLRSAIKVYALLVNEQQKGNKVFLQDSQGKMIEIKIVF